MDKKALSERDVCTKFITPAIGQLQQGVVAGVILQEETALFDGDFFQALFASRAFELFVLLHDGGLVLTVLVVGELEEDQAEHGRALFAGLEVGVGAELVGSGPEVALQLLELVSIHEMGCLFRSGGQAFGELLQEPMCMVHRVLPAFHRTRHIFDELISGVIQ